jgi:hypothetical protein
MSQWWSLVLPDVMDIAADFSNGVKFIQLLQALFHSTKPKVRYNDKPRFASHIRETRNVALQYARDLGIQFPTTWDQTIFDSGAIIVQLVDWFGTGLLRRKPGDFPPAASIARLRIDVGKMAKSIQDLTLVKQQLLRRCEDCVTA